MDYTPIRNIHIYGSGVGPNTDAYWKHMLTAEVQQPCGKLFGAVFDQYGYVCLVSPRFTKMGVCEIELHRDSCLLTVMRILEVDLRDGPVEVYAKNPEKKREVKRE
jgi:hypothetical protein